MKHFYIFMIAIGTNWASACPKINNTYSCSRFTAGYVLKTEKANDIWHITINGERYIADGKTHKLEAKGVNGTYNLLCNQHHEFFFSQRYNTDDNPTPQTETSVFSFPDRENNTLLTDQEFTFGGDNGLALRIDDRCTKEPTTQ